MRTSKLTMCIVILVAFVDCAAQTPPWWEFARYGNDGQTLIGHAVITRPAGYWLAGEGTTVGNGRDAVLLIAPPLFSSATKVSFGGPGQDRASDLIATVDGGALMIGTTDSYPVAGLSATNAFAVKFDPTGQVEWSRQYGGAGIDQVRRVIETSDGGYLVAGQTTSFGTGGADAWLLRLDDDGELQWSNAYGSAAADMGNDVVELADGAFVLVGTTADIPVSGTAAFLVKVGPTGVLRWSRTYDRDQLSGWNTHDRRGSEVLVGVTGKIVVGGTIGGYDTGSSVASDAYLMQVDTSGASIEWCRSFHFNSGHTYVHRLTTAGGNYAGAMERGLSNGAVNLWSPMGSAIWNRYITLVPPFGADRTYGFSMTDEGGFVTCGYQVFGTDTALLVGHGTLSGNLCFQGDDDQVSSVTNQPMEMTIVSFTTTPGGSAVPITFTLGTQQIDLNEHCANTAVEEQASSTAPLLSPTVASDLRLLRLDGCDRCADAIELVDVHGRSRITGVVRIDGSIHWNGATDLPVGAYIAHWQNRHGDRGTSRLLIVH